MRFIFSYFFRHWRDLLVPLWPRQSADENVLGQATVFFVFFSLFSLRKKKNKNTKYQVGQSRRHPTQKTVLISPFHIKIHRIKSKVENEKNMYLGFVYLLCAFFRTIFLLPKPIWFFFSSGFFFKSRYHRKIINISVSILREWNEFYFCCVVWWSKFTLYIQKTKHNEK